MTHTLSTTLSSGRPTALPIIKIDGLEVGLEYELARRINADMASNHADRMSLMCFYTFLVKL